MSDYKAVEMLNSEMYSLTETIEREGPCVTATPNLWIIAEDELLWPPGPANRKKPGQPQPNWMSLKCTILKRNIATFEEALVLEKRYSKHRDSDSFRAAEDLKKLKRSHPINENSNFKSALIDMNLMVNEIDDTAGRAKIPRSSGDSDANVMARSQNKYHDQCYETIKPKIQSGASGNKKNVKPSTVKKPVPLLKKCVMLEKKNIMGNDKDSGKGKMIPRYKNYLKSGDKNKQSDQKNPAKERKASASATVTKQQYLNQKGISENDFQKTFSSLDPSPSSVPSKVGLKNSDPVASRKPVGPQIDQSAEFPLQNRYGNVASTFMPVTSNGDFDDIRYAHYAQTANVVENVVPNPSMNSTPMLTDFSFQSKLLSYMSDIKKICVQSELKRVNFEARMQTQWEVFATKMSQCRFGNQEEQPDEVDDDFDDLDEQFPKNVEAQVEELEFNIRQDFVFKRRLFNRMDQLGGSKPNEAIRLRMKYLFTDKVLDKYTWRGTAEKRAFQKFTFLNDLIYKNVRVNFKKFPIKLFNSYMVTWLKHSTTRQRTVTYHYPNPRPTIEENEIASELDEQDVQDDEDEYNYFEN